MGVTKRPNGRWRARIIGPDGRERARHFIRRSDALRWETDQRAALNRGAWVDPSGPITVGEYAREWATTRPHRPSTARRTATLINVHIAGTSIENRRLASLRPSEVQAWATERSQILAPSTTRSAVQLLRSIYNAATLDLLVGSNPVIGVKLPAYERERIVPLTVAQVQALADAMPERCRAMVMTQAGLGLRIGELFALRAQDVDFLRRTVRIEWQFAPRSAERSRPKTPRSRRAVPLPDVVGRALAAHMASYTPGSDDSIFTRPRGQPWNHDSYRNVFVLAVKEGEGVPETTTSHDLRHHYASVLLAAGESVVTVAERLGHENAALVLSTYGHVMPNSEDQTRRAVDGAWAGLFPDSAEGTGS